MARHIIQLEKDADRTAIISTLSLWGEVEQLSEIPRMLFLNGPASAEGAILGIPGVMSSFVETSDDFQTDSVHDFVPMNPENTGQLPLVLHGNGPRNRLFDNTYDLFRPGGTVARFNYDPTPNDGTGVNIYVVDSGITPGHVEFTGRFGGQIFQRNGATVGFHGNACASVAAGANLGVATGATVYDCKGFPATGGASSSDLISAMNAALSHYNGGSAPGVVNCSFGGQGGSNSYSTVIDSCVSAGLVVVASSGNDSRDLTSGTNVWPSEDPDAVTVGGTDSFMRLHENANHYGAVDIYAMFQQWTTADAGGNNAYRAAGRIRGTSFSGPMVAGAIARELTGTTKMSSRAETEAFIANFLDEWGELDMIDKDGTPFDSPRLFIPGVTKVGDVSYSFPTRDIPDNTPIQIDSASTHIILGASTTELSVKQGITHAILGRAPEQINVSHGITHAIIEE